MVKRSLQRFLVLAAVVIGMLPGCAQQPPPRPVAAAPPPNTLPALTILGIQQKAYAQGFAAGKWVQARRDSEEAAQQAKESVTAKAVPDIAAPDNGTSDPGMPDTTAQTVNTQPGTTQMSTMAPASTSATPPAPAPDFVPAGPAQAIPAQQ